MGKATTPLITKKFATLQTLEEVKVQLDLTFNRLMDILGNNPAVSSLLNPKDAFPDSKPGDIIAHYADGGDAPKLEMSVGDGDRVPFDIGSFSGSITDETHGALDAVFENPPGSGTFSQLHPSANHTDPGFMSSADKIALDGLGSPSDAIPALVSGNTGVAGTSNDYSRSDHAHEVNITSTNADIEDVVGGSSSAGSSNKLAAADHKHFHGNLGGGTLHTVVGASAGFMSVAQATQLASLAPLGTEVLGYLGVDTWGAPAAGLLNITTAGQFGFYNEGAFAGPLYLVSYNSGVGRVRVLLV